MLGELYVPSGLALETAQQVLEVENPLACNVALGCPNGCTYCYGPLCTKISREQWLKMRFPKKSPKELVQDQLTKAFIQNPLSSLKGVFISFLTDCFHVENQKNTEDLIQFLHEWDWNIRIATSSKLRISMCPNIRNGISIVSLDEEFQKKYEPNTLPPKSRLKALCIAHEKGYTWASLEPYPPSAIHKQEITPLLEELNFWGVDFIIFGMWNYDKRARTEQSRQEYKANIEVLRDFCRSHNIRYHIKSDTLKFVNGG